ncbi:unnamed protein product (macronuclear) [Paramecium tetraurelia]|uniref:Uncharacterized protein n=1 Tax=Paramecium tetraurelia TaxID=5888 RepID=A0CRI2_PARTE|nr:uncharacterized protein GSPATT00009714001 [Paramecium tetraurelia]CAK73399.1 unnamed protein product [Paramecium tetraurelia]|eukprot:XP_001440796.1 hypothetical protein (macronuclear) [Paramecium tetraurelia strain d4-2]
MSQNLTYKSPDDIKFDEDLERILDKFIIKLCCALFMDFVGLLLMFLVFDFSFSTYIFGFSLVNTIFEFLKINDIRYPLRAIVGVACIVLAIIGFNIIGSVLAGIKNRKNPYIYLKGAFNRYVGKIREAKFKRN